MDQLLELKTIEKWIWNLTSVKSMEISTAPQKVARPVILWETPHVKRDRHLGRYSYVKKTTQYGVLYVSNLAEALRIENELLKDIEEKVGILPVLNKDGEKIGWLRDVELVFNGKSLDIPFNITYDAIYSRIRPEDPGPAAVVRNKNTTQ